ncbi:MAG: DUF427 domain-containing protein [Streptosporangiaceae bacterium]
MGLMIGTGPFGQRSTGVFNADLAAPAHLLYFEPSPKRVRVELGGETIADSEGMRLLHESRLTPVYYFPESDVRRDLLVPTDHATRCPVKGQASYWSVVVGGRRAENAAWGYPEPLPSAPWLAGYVAFDWGAMDAWYEEDEQVFVHPRDPYTRIDVLRGSRKVRVRVDGTVVAETSRPSLLFETGLPARYYLPSEDVRTDLLESSDTVTRCPYKGAASYWSVRSGDGLVRDAVWSYPEPFHDAEPVAGMFCFYDERVDLEVSGL